jgi:hypothetical protein
MRKLLSEEKVVKELLKFVDNTGWLKGEFGSIDKQQLSVPGYNPSPLTCHPSEHTHESHLANWPMQSIETLVEGVIYLKSHHSM